VERVDDLMPEKSSSKYCQSCKFTRLTIILIDGKPKTAACPFCLSKEPQPMDLAARARFSSAMHEHEARMKLQLEGDA
jgi:hypothetical protein